MCSSIIGTRSEDSCVCGKWWWAGQRCNAARGTIFNNFGQACLPMLTIKTSARAEHGRLSELRGRYLQARHLGDSWHEWRWVERREVSRIWRRFTKLFWVCKRTSTRSLCGFHLHSRKLSQVGMINRSARRDESSTVVRPIINSVETLREFEM